MTDVHDFQLLDPSDERWQVFLASRPEANIFHHPAWINNLAEYYNYHPFIATVLDTDGKISAGLPIMEINSFLTGKRWVSLPFTDHCAPLYRDSESLSKLTKSLVAFSKDREHRKLELRWEFPQNSDIQLYSRYVFHTIQLDVNPEIVFRRMQKKIRQLIHVAEKKEVRVEQGTTQEYLRSFYHHQLYTRRRHGVPPQPWKFFELLGKNLLEKGLGFVLLAYKDNDCIAGKVILYWQTTFTFKFQASDKEELDLRPNHLLSWTAIQWACEHGFNVVDMGRSEISETGLREFKSRWGAEEKTLTYSTISTPPPELTTGKLMTVMNILIRNSPVWVNKLTGELLYRHIA